jgi:hypothetical protein
VRRLVTAKYLKDGDFYKSNGNMGSQFWKAYTK